MCKPSRKQHHANRATARMVRISPRKARLVNDLIRNKSVEEALNILAFTSKRAAPVVTKLIDSAIQSIDESEQLDWDVDELIVGKIFVDEGPTLKRFKPRAMGRATRINKRTSHITVELQPRTAPVA